MVFIIKTDTSDSDCMPHIRSPFKIEAICIISHQLNSILMHQVAVLLGNHKLSAVSLIYYISWQNCLFPLSNIVNVNKISSLHEKQHFP